MKRKRVDVENLSASLMSEVVEMAWCDKTSFDDIKSQLDLSEQATIRVMRRHLKPSSFKLWRRRVSGRVAKHRQLRQNA
ncbi:TIGR03643 family protein [Umboniibacter marinipuniceus]|uniref:Uncharacterized protein (TIGR03643 family) n=1 Tax=Umboniibacter marinipuniceus TaxID=569599 RepID=A0A3M0A2T9_9GAMM|nr:TIGR03643 family protein [Umboniibacter marinipuniceus]RMA78764.1 uncharacterized protein (TIGR03643 family) [Umboniibacter marinipuniceus]